MTDYLEGALLNHIRGGTAMSQPAGLYVKLHTGDPGEAATGNAAANTTRQAVTLGTPTDGVSTNSSQVQWTNVSNTETYSHVSIWDASTAGNALFKGSLTTPVSMTAGETFTISAGQLSVTLA